MNFKFYINKSALATPKEEKRTRGCESVSVGKSTTYLEFYGNKFTRKKQAPGRKKI